MLEFECCCCFDSIELNRAISCTHGHVACTDCLKRALNVAVGDRSVLRCFHQSVCTGVYTEVALNRGILDSKLKTAYDNVVALKSITEAQLKDTISCPFCDNIVIYSGNGGETSFYCNECKCTSCKSCKKQQHTGPCNQQRHNEELATDTYILTCICHAKLVRGDGCNHMQCTNCRSHWCWICKKRLVGDRNTMYSHFGDAARKCLLFGERKEGQIFAKQVPATVSKRKMMDVDAVNDVVIGACCDRPKGDIICNGFFKKNGLPCTKKVRNGHLKCGFHNK